MKAYFHGEVCVKAIAELPKGLSKVEPKSGRYIIADSETTGNHHCVEAVDAVEIYEKDGVLYLKNEVAVKMFCVDQARHDTEIVPPGIWEVNRAKEYDYLTEMVRSVED